MSAQSMILYSYFRSSCSARVRTAAHLKGLKLEYSYIHLLKGQQREKDYNEINPMSSVPTLVYISADGTQHLIRQSVAILEFFEEQFPSTRPLLPPLSDTIARARVRDLVNIINADTQPVSNLRIFGLVKPLGVEAADWARPLMLKGLQAYDKLAEQYSGKYSVGDEITLADVTLAPAVEGAIRFGVDLNMVPIVKRIYETIKDEDAFRMGDWKHQPDTPEEFRTP